MFIAFLVIVGGLQFVYCVIVGNYVRFLSPSIIYGNAADDTLQPFNAFLSGFSATVGQFVLTGMPYSRYRERETQR
jgi:oligosaccharyltransferase complex subunit epsilon